MSITAPTRRQFLRQGSLWLAAAPLANAAVAAGDPPAIRIGLLTDLHYADKDPKGSRHYRETLAKLEEAGAFFERRSPAFVVELGDLIDAAADVPTEMGYLKRIGTAFAAVATNRHHVLGNHCVDTLTKAEFLGGVGQERSYYSFDAGGFHFVVLDACFRADGVGYERKNFDWKDANLPPAELEWLRADLATATGGVVVFAHQRLDTDDVHAVRNAAEVRAILEASGKVRAVFQGHSHKNALSDLGGIHYVTLRAMVEGSGATENGYSLLSLHPDGRIELEGERMQSSHEWAAAGPA